MTRKFKSGDRVRRIDGNEILLKIGEVYVIDIIYSYQVTLVGYPMRFHKDYFELVEDEEEYDTEI